MISGYSKEIQKLLKDKAITIGQDIIVKKQQEQWEGFLMPSRSPDHLVIKLYNGYNIGISFSKDVVIEKKKERREPKKAEVKVVKNKPDKSKPTISLLSTGGTVASRIDYKTGAVSTAFTSSDLYTAVPELKDIANFRIHQVFQMWSQDLEPEHWILLAKKIEEEIKAGVDGVIITQGTDTIHFTTAALSFMLRNVPVPVMVVGSQRSSDRGSSDASMNLICASNFIANADFAGVSVCMHGSSDDEYCFVNDSTNVRKMHTSRRDTFRSIDVLPFAKVHMDGEIEWIRDDYTKKDKSRKLDLKAVFEKNIALIKSYPGFSYKILEAYEKLGCKGIIIEGTGLGHLPNRTTDNMTKDHEKINKVIERMTKKGVIILITSQCPYGRVNLNVYSAQRVLLDAGIFQARMTTETAYVKLGWALGQTKNIEKVKEILMTNYAGEIVERVDPRGYLY